jgi:flagellin
MPISIVSNMSALIAQRNLQKVSENITTSTTRLTSGERVFSAGEDAAAIGVGSGLRINAATLGKAVLNATSGISIMQIAEGSLSQISDMVQRMKSLASQASSGQISDQERIILDGEYQLLKDEIDRVAADTDFNGQKLLSGSALYDVSFAQTIQALGVTAPQFDSTIVTSDATFRVTYDNNTEELSLSRIEGGTPQVQTIDITQLLDDIAGVGQNLTPGESLEVNFSGPGVTVTLNEAFNRNTNLSPVITDNSGGDIAITLPPPVAPAVVTPAMTYATDSVTKEAVDAFIALDANPAYSLTSGVLTVPINTDGTNVTLGGITGVRYSVNGGAVGADGAASTDLATGTTGFVDFYLTTAAGDQRIARLAYDDMTTSGTTDGTLDIPLGRGLFDADTTSGAGNLDLTFMVGTGINPAEDRVVTSIQPVTTSQLGLTTSAITTVTGAESAMVLMDNTLDTINQMRSILGADEQRLEFVSSQLAGIIENTEAARSALLDTNIAEEVTNLTSNETMMELGVSVLARANLQPQRLLRLLEGA